MTDDPIQVPPVEPVPPNPDDWRLVHPGEVGPKHGGHGSWVETNHPAVVDCMGSDPACAENGCQLKRTLTEPSHARLESIKRYDLVVSGSGYYTSNELEPAFEGDWVRYDDVLAALAESRSQDGAKDETT